MTPIKAEQLEQVLDVLDDREREVVVRYFGLEGRKPEMLNEIAETLERGDDSGTGVSNTRAGQLKERGVMKCVEALRERGTLE